MWTGSPQWQIEGLRRLEIPEDMQKAHGFAPLGAADGAVKTAIFGGNNAALYGIDPALVWAAMKDDVFARRRAQYLREGARPNHTRYGYMHPGGEALHSVFA